MLEESPTQVEGVDGETAEGRVVVSLCDESLAGSSCVQCGAPTPYSAGFPAPHFLRGSVLGLLCYDCARPSAGALVEGVACCDAACEFFAAQLRDASAASLPAYSAGLFVAVERLYWSLFPAADARAAEESIIQAGDNQ